MEKAEEVLAKHPFCGGLDPRLLEVFCSCASYVRYEAGEMIYKEGDEANQALLIQDGRVAIEIFAAQRGSLVIETLSRGDVAGWSFLFPPYRRRFDTRAIEPTTAIALDGKYLREKAAEDHRFGCELLKRFSMIVVERLHATTLQLLDVYGKHP